MLAYQAIVFDMDGTILDTLEDLWRSVNFALEKEGLPPRTMAQVRQDVGNAYRNLIRLSCPQDASAALRERVLTTFLAHYERHCNDHTAPYPGILSLLRRLKEAGARLAVVSNKGDAAVRILAERHFPGLFDAVAGQKDEVPRKPDPTMVRLALAVLGASASGACYVGDSEVDIKTARNAGLPLLLVTWGFRDPAQLIAAGGSDLIASVDALGEALLG